MGPLQVCIAMNGLRIMISKMTDCVSASHSQCIAKHVHSRHRAMTNELGKHVDHGLLW